MYSHSKFEAKQQERWAYRAPEPLHTSHRLDGFASGEPALDDWLARYALAEKLSGTARVYVSTLDDEQTVVDFFAVAAAQVSPAEATARAMKGQLKGRPVPPILLARLAVDQAHQRSGVGRSLLQDALPRCLQAAAAIGGRVLLVHAKHDKAKNWYLQFGSEESAMDPLRLQLIMKDMRASLSSLVTSEEPT